MVLIFALLTRGAIHIALVGTFCVPMLQIKDLKLNWNNKEKKVREMKLRKNILIRNPVTIVVKKERIFYSSLLNVKVCWVFYQPTTLQQPLKTDLDKM